MVSDERRRQLNLQLFEGQVLRHWQAYHAPRPEPWQKLWRCRSCSASATLSSLLPAGASVLDVGCGVGALAHRLADQGFEVTAIDQVPGMLEQARRQGPSSIRWIQAPFADGVVERGTFDAVVSLGYLEYQERAGKELVRMGRMLKPGGYLVLSVPNTLSRQFAFGVGRAIYRLGKEPERTSVRHAFTPERLQRLLGMAGYILIDYEWLDAESEPLALSRDRPRRFWNHRLRDRFHPEMITLSRTYRRDDTASPEEIER